MRKQLFTNRFFARVATIFAACAIVFSAVFSFNLFTQDASASQTLGMGSDSDPKSGTSAAIWYQFELSDGSRGPSKFQFGASVGQYYALNSNITAHRLPSTRGEGLVAEVSKLVLPQIKVSAKVVNGVKKGMIQVAPPPGAGRWYPSGQKQRQSGDTSFLTADKGSSSWFEYSINATDDPCSSMKDVYSFVLNYLDSTYGNMEGNYTAKDGRTVHFSAKLQKLGSWHDEYHTTDLNALPTCSPGAPVSSSGSSSGSSGSSGSSSSSSSDSSSSSSSGSSSSNTSTSQSTDITPNIEENCVSTSIIQTEDGKYCDDGQGGGVYDILNVVLTILTFGIGIAATAGLAICGIKYATAGTNEAQATNARRRIFEIVIGLVAYAIMYLALQWLIPNFS